MQKTRTPDANTANAVALELMRNELLFMPRYSILVTPYLVLLSHNGNSHHVSLLSSLDRTWIWDTIGTFVAGILVPGTEEIKNQLGPINIQVNHLLNKMMSCVVSALDKLKQMSR